MKILNVHFEKANELSDATKEMYKRQLLKLYDNLPKKTVTILKDTKLVLKTIDEIYTNTSSKKSIINAICQFIKKKHGYSKTYWIYDKVRNDLSGELNAKRGENTINDPNKWLDYSDLLKIPSLVAKDIKDNFGSVYLSNIEYQKLDKKQKFLYAKLLTEYMFIYIVIKYPLRLDYYNLPISNREIKNTSTRNNTKFTNYLLVTPKYIRFYLNEYKTVKKYGPQLIDFSSDNKIRDYLDELKILFGKDPEYFLYHTQHNKLVLFGAKVTYSHKITNLIKHYTGKHINNNTIRKIYESHLIQSEDYKHMTNAEKDKAHMKLLHSTRIANLDYNKVKPKNKMNIEYILNPKVCDKCKQVIRGSGCNCI